MQLPCRKTMIAVPAVAGSFGRPGPGPVPSLSTPPRKDCPPWRLGASRVGGPGLSTASSNTSAWRIWRAPETAGREPPRGQVLAWWAAAIVIRSGYVPLAFGRRRLWAATADAALLFAVMARYALLARRIDQRAALLAVPEVAWTGFATVLSTAVATINSQ
jgi:hypothetical protein